MAKKKIDAASQIYQLKVMLLGMRPPVWRRLLVPGDCTLEEMHIILRASMGWEDDHLHGFEAGKKQFGPAMEDDDPDVIDEADVRLADVLAKVGSKMRSTYDFGDNWEHDIVIEKVLPRVAGKAYPVCTAGKRLAPPEDSGGAGGYAEMLEAISDPNREDHEEMTDWVGEGFDPEKVSLGDLNEQLKPLPESHSKS